MSIGASAIRAGEAFVEIFARDKTDKGIKTSLQKFRSLSIAVAALGATMTATSGVIFGGLGKSLHMFSDFGSRIADSLGRTSLSSELTQALRLQAEMAGASLEDLEAAVQSAQKTIAKAAEGNEQAAAKFRKLGLSVSELVKLSPDQQFLAIAQGVSQIEDPAARATAAMDVLGGSAGRLMSILKEGGEGILQNFQMMQENGLILSDEDIDNADRLGDAWDMLMATLGAATRVVGAALAPALIRLLDFLQMGAAWVARFASANRGLTIGLALFAAAIGAAGAALTAFGTAGILVTGVVAGWSTIVTVAVGAWGMLVTAIGMVASALGLIATPMGLVVLGVAGVAAAIGSALILFFQLTDVGRGVWRDLAAGFGFLGGIAAQTFGAIFAALSAGQWQKAGEVAMAALAVAWQSGMGALVSIFTGFADWFVSGIASMLKKAIDLVAAFYADPTWKGFLDGFFAATGAGVAGKGVDKVASNAAAAKSAIDNLAGSASAWLDALDSEAVADLQQALADFEAARKAAHGDSKFKAPDWLRTLVGGGGVDSLVTAQAASSFGSFSGSSAGFQGIGKSSTFAPITEKLEEGNDLLAKILDAVESERGPEFGE